MATNYYTNSSEDSIDGDEYALYELIMDYRADLGLPSIPLSAGLSATAGRHVLDSVYNTGYVGHSWSDAPYDSANSATYPNMWEAPQRLGTSYDGYGFEISTGFLGDAEAFYMSPARALSNWQNSAPHDAVITNEGVWSDQWGAIGIGMHKGIAHVWFGNEFDPGGPPVYQLSVPDTGVAFSSTTIDWRDDVESLELVSSTYQYFTGFIPSAGGFEYLISSPANPVDLNDPYYDAFNTENRYINFASNLGTGAENSADFLAFLDSYGYSEIVELAYDEIVGFNYAESLGINTADATDFFNDSYWFYADVAAERVVRPGVSHDVATKIVLIGSMLNEAIKADVGRYADEVDSFVDDVVVTGSSPEFGNDLFAIV